MSNNNYLSWFFKHDLKEVRDMRCHVEPVKGKSPAKIYFTLKEPGKTYTFAINFVDAVSADGETALPSYTRESEVDAVFNDYVNHARQLFDAR